MGGGGGGGRGGQGWPARERRARETAGKVNTRTAPVSGQLALGIEHNVLGALPAAQIWQSLTPKPASRSAETSSQDSSAITSERPAGTFLVHLNHISNQSRRKDSRTTGTLALAGRTDCARSQSRFSEHIHHQGYHTVTTRSHTAPVTYMAHPGEVRPLRQPRIRRRDEIEPGASLASRVLASRVLPRAYTASARLGLGREEVDVEDGRDEEEGGRSQWDDPPAGHGC